MEIWSDSEISKSKNYLKPKQSPRLPMKKSYQVIDRRDFFKKAALGVAGLSLAPSLLANVPASGKLRTVHIGLGGMGMEDLKAIASHASVEVVGLCDVDTNALSNATALYPQAKTYSDYRLLLKEMEDQFDAVVVSTPDHTHAPPAAPAGARGRPGRGRWRCSRCSGRPPNSCWCRGPSSRRGWGR